MSEQDVLNSDFLLSCGLNDDWSFEADFIKANSVPAICYDGSVSLARLLRLAAKNLAHFPDPRPTMQSIKAAVCYRHFFNNGNCPVEHRNVNVGADITGRSLGFSHVLSDIESDNIFLKMDIEGHEYYCLNDILENERRLTGLAIEFHEVPLFLTKIIDFINSLSELKICNVHPNNFGHITDSFIPTVIEITFSKLVGANDEKLSEWIGELNRPCDPSMPEIQVQFARS